MIRKVFFLALNTGYASDGLPTDEARRFYADRSSHGLHAAIVGNVLLPAGYGTNSSCMRISQAEQWKSLVAAIRDRGAVPGIQLSTTWPGYEGMRAFKARSGSSASEMYREVARSITPDLIDQVFADLELGTRLAVDAGFRHVQLHAAHGYFFSLLVDRHFCSHFQKALESIDSWGELVANTGAESSIRISLSSGNREIDSDRGETIDSVCGLSADYIDVSDGYYNINKHLIYPSKADAIRARHEQTIQLARRFPDQSFILSGRAADAQNVVDANVHVGLCRDLIANPDFLRDRASGCANKMKCHFYSTGQQSLSCAQWNGPRPSSSLIGS